MFILNVLILSLFNLKTIRLKRPLSLSVKGLFNITVFLRSRLLIGANSLLTASLNIFINILILNTSRRSAIVSLKIIRLNILIFY
jgi:hypothetical protein